MALRVVIVGATGNVGTSLVQALGDEPEVESIVGLARRLPDWSPRKTTWARADVTRTNLASHFRGADVVVHLAWIFQPTHDALATWRTNALGSIRVFEAVAKAGVPALVYASSIGSYASGPPDGRPVDESWPTHALPTAAYGREKSYVERILDTFERDHPDIRVVRLRPAFIFKRESASEQRRLFAGPLLPGRLVRPELIPFVPDIEGLRLQALHSADAAQAYRLAVVRPVRGAFNVAADPVLDPKTLAEFLDARPVRVPPAVVRAVIAAGWHLHLIPASPTLFDLALSLPVMDSRRARDELGWEPTRTSLEAIGELFAGLRTGAGMDTPPLRPDAGGWFRGREVATGIGDREPHDALGHDAVAAVGTGVRLGRRSASGSGDGRDHRNRSRTGWGHPAVLRAAGRQIIWHPNRPEPGLRFRPGAPRTAPSLRLAGHSAARPA